MGPFAGHKAFSGTGLATRLIESPLNLDAAALSFQRGLWANDSPHPPSWEHASPFKSGHWKKRVGRVVRDLKVGVGIGYSQRSPIVHATE